MFLLLVVRSITSPIFKKGSSLPLALAHQRSKSREIVPVPILPSWYALERFSIFMAMDIVLFYSVRVGTKTMGVSHRPRKQRFSIFIAMGIGVVLQCSVGHRPRKQSLPAPTCKSRIKREAKTKFGYSYILLMYVFLCCVLCCESVILRNVWWSLRPWK